MLKLKFDENNFFECGVDEAGAGPLMGPVVAAAVIWNYPCEKLNDSKKLTPKKRRELVEVIKTHADDWSVAFVDEQKIDDTNILKCRIEAMHLAVGKLELIDSIELLLVDGNRFNSYEDIPYEMIVKGDSKYQSIAAASILAKEAHDDWVVSKHSEFPNYGWDRNKGYGTKEHIAAIKKWGPTKYHRKTFLSRIL